MRGSSRSPTFYMSGVMQGFARLVLHGTFQVVQSIRKFLDVATR